MHRKSTRILYSRIPEDNLPTLLAMELLVFFFLLPFQGCREFLYLLLLFFFATLLLPSPFSFGLTIFYLLPSLEVKNYIFILYLYLNPNYKFL